MTDEKQIEEMAKVFTNFEKELIKEIYEGLGIQDWRDECIWKKARVENLALRLAKKYQPKLPENAVVLTKEEHKQWIKDCIESNKVVEERTRKETVRGLLKALKAKQVICSPEEDNFVYMLDINELAKQHGVEVEE